jgi:hypothetical protein
MLRKENDRAGTEEGGFKSYLPPMGVGGSFAPGGKREGGWPATPPPDSGSGLVPGSRSGGYSAGVFRRRGGFCTGFHSNGAGKILSLTRGVPDLPPPHAGGGVPLRPEEKGRGVGRQPPPPYDSPIRPIPAFDDGSGTNRPPGPPNHHKPGPRPHSAGRTGAHRRLLVRAWIPGKPGKKFNKIVLKKLWSPEQN